MKKLLLALILLLAAGGASAETCAFTASGNWSAVGTYSGTHSCVVGGLSADDDLTVNSGVVVTVTGSIGTAGAPRTGLLTVASGGELDFSVPVNYYSTNGVFFDSGSCANDSCNVQGTALTAIGAATVTYPTATTINFDFDNTISAGGVLPWTLCAAACGSSVITTAATSNTGVATYIMVGWNKIGDTITTQVVGSGDQLKSEFVDGPGVWMEVTAVNAAGNDFTVTLPPITANSLLYHYAVAEAATGNILQNIRSGSTWTVADVETRENNEGKIRYETVISNADAPFNADHEFEGYLACAQGTDRCLRITETEADYALPVMPGTAVAAGSEMFVTWANPEDPKAYKWTTGNELDIYYIKVGAGDTLTPINPVRFDFTGSTSATQSTNMSVRVRANSGLFTMRNLIFQDANMANDVVNQGAISLENYATSDSTKTFENILAEGCNSGSGAARVIGVAANTLPACIRIQDVDSEGGTGVGVRNVRWNNLTIRWPQEVIDWTTNPTVDGFGQAAVQMTEQTGEAISNATWFNAGQVVNWNNMSIRQVRVEGFETGFGVANTGILTNCPDGAWIKDALILHSRSRKGDDSGANMSNYTRRGEDQLETFGTTPTCGYDRFVIGQSNVGTGFGPLRHAQRGRTEHTSFAVFGGSGKVENGYQTTDFGTGRRPYVNGAIPHTIASGPEGHVTSFPNANSDGIAIFNWMTDGNMGSISSAYGQRMGWYRQQIGVLPAGNCGQFTVGMVAIGGGGLSYFGGLDDCAGPYTEVYVADNFLVNLGRYYNSGYEQTCDTSGLNVGTSRYPCVGNAIFPALFTTANSIDEPVPDLRMEYNLFHRGIRTGAWVGCCANWGSYVEVAHTSPTTANIGITISNTSAFNEAGTAQRLISVLNNQVDTVSITNTWLEGGATLDGCQVSGGTFGPVDRQDCDFTASGGLDWSSDDSPHGAVNTYWSGDLASTFKQMKPIGKSGGTGDPTTAVPRHAGIVAWEWPHAWMTPEVITYHTADPNPAYIPARLRARMGTGGSTSETFAPSPF